MKNQISRICSLILVLLFVMILIGCGEGFRSDINENADDDISEAIYNAVGSEKVYYQGQDSDNPDKLVIYEYLVNDYEDENLLMDMVEAINVVMYKKKTAKKILLDIRGRLPGGAGTESVVSLRNYYKDEEEYRHYKELQCLYICGNDISYMGDESLYNKASTYIILPDIKSLVVTKKIAENAEEEGIDWYEIWPDLEYYEVLED